MEVDEKAGVWGEGQVVHGERAEEVAVREAKDTPEVGGVMEVSPPRKEAVRAAGVSLASAEVAKSAWA